MKEGLFISSIAPLAVCALLLPSAVSAQPTPFTAYGWVNGVPWLGIAYTNALGQVLKRGVVKTAQVQATDARVTGQVLIIADAAYNPDGTVNLQGPAYLQVGTWDPAGTNFTPTGGLWEMNWQGVMQTNNTVEISIAGYGSGGAIDGWRLQETVTGTVQSAPIALPYSCTGTIKPPVSTSVVVDNFDDNIVTGWSWFGTGTQFPFLEANQRFAMRGRWPGIHSSSLSDAYAWAMTNWNWSVDDGNTLELRADLVGISEDATNMAAIYLAGNWDNEQFYAFAKGRDFVMLTKWVKAYGNDAVLVCDPKTIKNTNVVLSLALTRIDPNLILTARVLDKDNDNAVLYEHSVVDTPQADPCLTAAKVLAASGMSLNVVPDATGAPYTSGAGIILGPLQYSDGAQPVVQVIYDNVELRTYEVPRVSMERALRLYWPSPAGVNWSVQAGPTPQGPWLPVQDLEIPGIRTFTVPLSGAAQFFRLQQAP